MSIVQHLSHYHLPLDVDDFMLKVKECPHEPDILQQLWQLVKPFIFWREEPITSHKHGSIILGDNDLIIPSIYVAQGLAECQRATVLAFSLGQALPHEAEKCAERGELYRSSLADLLGSHGVEMLAESFCNYLQQKALVSGKFATLRYSPGYGDWALAEQREVLRFLDNCQGKIQLSENYLMEPVKSITAIIGWSNQPQRQEYPQGEHNGFCNGGHNCAACTTWACRK